MLEYVFVFVQSELEEEKTTSSILWKNDVAILWVSNLFSAVSSVYGSYQQVKCAGLACVHNVC